MLAKFKNGYLLEVIHDEEQNEYKYNVYDKNGYWYDGGWTEYRNIELYHPLNLIDYIIVFCDPCFIEGKYEILKDKTMKKYLKRLKEVV